MMYTHDRYSGIPRYSWWTSQATMRVFLDIEWLMIYSYRGVFVIVPTLEES